MGAAVTSLIALAAWYSRQRSARQKASKCSRESTEDTAEATGYADSS